MKKVFQFSLSFLLFFIVFKLNAQTQFWNKMPTLEDSKMKVWAADTSAEAAILNNAGVLTMDIINNKYGFIFNEHKRIKIFKKSGFKYANVTIPFYHKDDWEFIDKMRAQVWLPDGRKVAVDPNTIFTEKLNERWSVKKITFPNVEEGAILEYEYEMTSYNVRSLREWFFQSEIPTRYSSLNLNIISRFEYSYLFQGQDNLKSTKPEYKNDQTHVTFYVEDLPGLKEEAFVSTMDDYRTRIRFQLSKYFELNGVQKQELTTWDMMARRLWDDPDFGKRITRKGGFDDALKAVAAQITEGDSAMSKIQKIYDFVNQKVSWNEYRSWVSVQSLNDVYKKGKGNTGEINLLLLGLLRENGIEANPVLISTRSNGHAAENFPIIDQFNHLIVHIQLEDGRTLLLEGGDKFRPLGYLSLSSLNKRGALVTKKDVKWIDINPPLSNEALMLDCILKPDGSVEGTVNLVERGYNAVFTRESIEKDETGGFIAKSWTKEFPDIAIDSVKFENKTNVKENLKTSYHCTIPSVADVANDMMYVKIPLHTGWENSPLKLIDRTYPVDIPYSISEQFAVNITIPKGYKVEEMPKPKNLQLPKDGGSFQFATTQQGDKISISIRIKVKQLLYTPGEYYFLKELFDDIAKKLQEQIVLKKTID